MKLDEFCPQIALSFSFPLLLVWIQSTGGYLDFCFCFFLFHFFFFLVFFSFSRSLFFFFLVCRSPLPPFYRPSIYLPLPTSSFLFFLPFFPSIKLPLMAANTERGIVIPRSTFCAMFHVLCVTVFIFFLHST